jgi:eukaryotic-like serine/threonine-protein kinase
MSKNLLVIEGPDQGRVFPLAGRALVVGSSNKNTDICLNDPYVSRLHCKIELIDDRVVVHDLKNSKGTFVNGTQVTRQDLQPGDLLRVGNSQLRLQAEAGAVPPNAEGVVQQPPTWLEELSGHTLGPYQVESILGAGRHGVVFKATGTRSGQVVALKVLAPDFPANEEELQHFIRIVKPVLPLRHPHLVTLHGAGKSGSYCWLAGDLIEGQTAAHLARAHRDENDEDEDDADDWRTALRMAMHVARALGFVHRNRLRHSNITPNNILWHAASESARLNDLVLGEALAGSALRQRVQEKKLLAELPYLAPEQFDENAFVDDLSDLYGLGVVTYEVLTGQLPYKSDTPEQTIELIREGMPLRPTKHRPGLPPDLERAVMKMMALRQEDRYSSAAELQSDLERIAEATGGGG